MEEVRELVHVNMGWLSARQRSGAALSEAAQEKERICLRFYAALVLLDLISEVGSLRSISTQPIYAVCGWVVHK